MGKSKKQSHKPKSEDTNQEKLYLLHMDICGPMRVASVNRKRKPDLSYLYVFGALCYPNNDSENLGKLQTKADIGLGLQFMTPATSSSGLVSNPFPQQSCNLPQRDDWDLLFQPMFDEYFNPPTIVVSPFLVAAAPRAVD
ncbi:hypothetical protein Tco_1246955 [Tanacetum coccineum]